MDVSNSVIAARMQALATVIDAAGVGASLGLYGTPRPGAGGDAGGSPLVSVSLAHPCGTVTGNTLSLADTSVAQIATSGIALWARIVDADGDWVADFSVGITPGANDPLPHPEVRLPSTQLYAGAFVGLIGAAIVGN